MDFSLSFTARLRDAAAQVRRVKSMAGTAMLTALNLVLNQFTVMVSQFLEIGFAFLATAMAGYLYGPFLAGLMGVATDTLGWLMRPNGAYLPFWAINECLLGMIYGCWFYRPRAAVARAGRLCHGDGVHQPDADAPVAAPAVRQRLCADGGAADQKFDQAAR